MGVTISREEFEKRLSSLLMEGRQMIFLDNINGELRSDVICQAVTGDEVGIRRFGVIENVRVSTRAVFAATGNGISIASDLNRRTLLSEIDTEMAKPQFKKYRAPEPIELIHADRAKYIAAALTIPLAYIAAGSPVVTDKAVADFADWSGFVRDPLVWMGAADPVLTMERAIETDIERQHARSIRIAMKTVCGLGARHPCQFIINAIVDPYANAESLREKLQPLKEQDQAWGEALMAIAGVGRNVSSKKLGHWFSVTKDVIDDGLVIRGEWNTTLGSHVWWVEEAKE
jgi:putative DNA primase/helicase